MTTLVIRKGLVWRVIMGTFHLLSAVVWPTRVRGRHHIPAEGCALVLANHQSALDIPLIAKAAHHRHLAFVARQSLARWRVMEFVMRHCGAIPIDRDRGDRSALRAMAEVLRAGGVVVIFPEGRRSRSGALGEPKKGALLAARQAGAPLGACAVDGSHAAWPPGRLPRPGRVRVTFGAPVAPDRPDALQATWSQVRGFLEEPAGVD